MRISVSNSLRKIKRQDDRKQKILDKKEKDRQSAILEAEREKEEKENPKPKMSATDTKLAMAAMLGLSAAVKGVK